MRIGTNRGYAINYDGGRLADVEIGGVAVECVQVRDYDFATGEFGAEPTRKQIRERVAELLDPEDMDNYRELARFYR
jgi:hypothetical protein